MNKAMNPQDECSGWTPALGVGVPEIDRQHEELYALTGAFLEEAGTARVDRLVELLAHLGAYIATHFATEEALMRRAAYPGLDAHVREHRAFSATFQRLVSAFARYGDDARVASEVERAVTEWLERHVATADMALGEFLRARSGAPLARTGT